jgi:hypothetical protein
MRRLAIALGLGLLAGQGLLAQSPPRLVPTAGVARDAAGVPQNGTATVTFAIYAAQEGGEPIWTETQQLPLDGTGQYSTLLGLTQKEGLPVDLFSEGQARWLAVSVNGGPEGPRAFWASVPYALKAADAATVSGLPAEAFLRSGSYRAGNDAVAMAPAADRDGMPPGVAVPADLNTPMDQVIADDLVVQGSTCSGLDCINNEDFGFDTLRVKENNTRIQFFDTSAAGFASNNWQIRANDSGSGGANFLGFVDQGADGFSETGNIVFRVNAGAPANSLVVDSSGRVGVRTATPVLDIHAATSNTPALRMEQNNSGGFTAQTWDIAGNEANFFVRDVTGGSRLPFRIQPGAPTNTLYLASTGNVGIGTLNPTAGLNISRSAGAFANVMELTNNSGVGFILNNTTRNRVFMSVNNPGTNFTLNFDDGDPAEFSLSETGALSGVTSCTGCSPPSDRNLKENFTAIDRDAVLKGLLGLDVSAWNYKSFNSAERHIGPMSQDFFQAFAVGNDVTLNPVDTFGVTAAAIQALSGQVQDLQRLVTELQAEIARLKQQPR